MEQVNIFVQTLKCGLIKLAKGAPMHLCNLPRNHYSGTAVLERTALDTAAVAAYRVPRHHYSAVTLV